MDKPRVHIVGIIILPWETRNPAIRPTPGRPHRPVPRPGVAEPIIPPIVTTRRSVHIEADPRFVGEYIDVEVLVGEIPARIRVLAQGDQIDEGALPGDAVTVANETKGDPNLGFAGQVAQIQAGKIVAVQKWTASVTSSFKYASKAREIGGCSPKEVVTIIRHRVVADLSILNIGSVEKVKVR